MRMSKLLMFPGRNRSPAPHPFVFPSQNSTTRSALLAKRISLSVGPDKPRGIASTEASRKGTLFSWDSFQHTRGEIEPMGTYRHGTLLVFQEVMEYGFVHNPIRPAIPQSIQRKICPKQCLNAATYTCRIGSPRFP